MANRTIRCKRIIDGKTYNTETATLLSGAEFENGIREYLFKTRHGAYFLYAAVTDDPDERLVPLSVEDAKRWTGKNAAADICEAEFGDAPDEGGPEARFTMRMPETLRKRIAAIAKKNKQSLNAWIVRSLEAAADTAKTAVRR